STSCVLDVLATRYLFVSRGWLATHADTLAATLPAAAAQEDRWQHVAGLENAAVFENRRARPRAWLVPEVLALEPEEIRQALQTSRLPDGRPFNPARLALVEEPVASLGECPDP